MSAYTTRTAILGEIQLSDLIALTDDDRTGQVNDTVLNQIIENSSGYIDSKIANIYGQQLPFNPVPSSVASMALTVTCYRLYRRRSIPDEKNNYNQDWLDVKEFLDRVNQGEAMIDDVPSRDFAQVAFTYRNTTFGSAGTNMPANSL